MLPLLVCYFLLLLGDDLSRHRLVHLLSWRFLFLETHGFY